MTPFPPHVPGTHPLLSISAAAPHQSHVAAVAS